MTNQPHEPSVSIVIPSFNRRHWIEEAIQSAIKQSYKNIVEIIVVDDASRDNTCAFLKAQYPNIKVIMNEQNSGACFSRNRGAEVALGEYIAFLDSDDQFHYNKVQLQMDAIRNSGALIATCAFEDIAGKVTCGKKLSQATTHSTLKYRNCLGGSSSLIINKKLFLDYKFDESFRAAQDWELFFRLSKTNAIIHLTTPLYLYGVVSNDRITSDAKSRYLGHKQLYDIHLNLYVSSNIAFFFLLNGLKKETRNKSPRKWNIQMWLYEKTAQIFG